MKGWSKWIVRIATVGGLAMSQHGYAQSAGTVIFVDRGQFDCLAEQIDSVPRENRGVFVDIRDCRSNGVRVMRGLITPPRPAGPAGVETVLYLKPAQVQCIRKNRRSLGRIATVATGNRYSVTLEPCRR